MFLQLEIVEIKVFNSSFDLLNTSVIVPAGKVKNEYDVTRFWFNLYNASGMSHMNCNVSHYDVWKGLSAYTVKHDRHIFESFSTVTVLNWWLYRSVVVLRWPIECTGPLFYRNRDDLYIIFVLRDNNVIAADRCFNFMTGTFRWWCRNKTASS